MPSAVKMRTDLTPAELRRLAASSKHANQSRRLLSLAAVLEGRSREEAARIDGLAGMMTLSWGILSIIDRLRAALQLPLRQKFLPHVPRMRLPGFQGSSRLERHRCSSLVIPQPSRISVSALITSTLVILWGFCFHARQLLGPAV